MFRVLASSRTIDTEQEQGERVEVVMIDFEKKNYNPPSAGYSGRGEDRPRVAGGDVPGGEEEAGGAEGGQEEVRDDLPVHGKVPRHGV